MAVLGQDSGSYTPQDVERKRRFAKMLMSDNFQASEPFGALAMALKGGLAGYNEYEAGQAEAQGRKTVADLLQNKDYTGALNSEWVSPQQSAIASMLQGREWDTQDRNAQWARDDARFAQQQAQRTPADMSQTTEGRMQLAQQYGLTGPDAQMYVLTGKLPGGQAGADGLGLNPVWGTDQQGNPVIMQISKDGAAVRTQLPEGVTPTNPYDLAGQKAGGAADAKTAAAARAALPGMEQAAQIANNALDLVLNDQQGLKEQFGNIAGIPQRSLPVLPGSSLGNWRANFEQAKGQSFMQARQMLKGGGPITDYEGQKADAAYSRMEQAAATGDEQNFRMAADDFRQALKVGMEKLRQVASGDYSAGKPAAPAGAPAGNDPLGLF